MLGGFKNSPVAFLARFEKTRWQLSKPSPMSLALALA